MSSKHVYDAPVMMMAMSGLEEALGKTFDAETPSEVANGVIESSDPYVPDPTPYPDSWGIGIRNPVNPDGGPEIMP